MSLQIVIPKLESFVKSGLILVGGEISSNAVVDIQKTVRDVVKHIGYDDTHKGLDYKNCNVLTVIEQQSADIAKGVHEGRKIEDIGAGDQVIFFVFDELFIYVYLFILKFSNAQLRLVNCPAFLEFFT